jgi:hypothetical protein
MLLLNLVVNQSLLLLIRNSSLRRWAAGYYVASFVKGFIVWQPACGRIGNFRFGSDALFYVSIRPFMSATEILSGILFG